MPTVTHPDRHNVVKEYLEWIRDSSTEGIAERTGMDLTNYWRKYVQGKYKMSAPTFIEYARKTQDEIQKCKVVEANFGALLGDEIAMRASTRRLAKSLLYQKLQKYIEEPELLDGLSMKECRNLYTDIRKEEDSDKALILKAVETKQKLDEWDLMKEQMQYGLAPVEMINEIRTFLHDVSKKYNGNRSITEPAESIGQSGALGQG